MQSIPTVSMLKELRTGAFTPGVEASMSLTEVAEEDMQALTFDVSHEVGVKRLDVRGSHEQVPFLLSRPCLSDLGPLLFMSTFTFIFYESICLINSFSPKQLYVAVLPMSVR